MEAAKHYFVIIAVCVILLLFGNCFSPNNTQEDWPSQNLMDGYSAANTDSFTAFDAVLITLLGLRLTENQASSEEKILKLRTEGVIQTIVFIMIVCMMVALTAVLATPLYQTLTKRTALRQIRTKKMGGLGPPDDTVSGQEGGSVSEALPLLHSMVRLKMRPARAEHRRNQQNHAVKYKQPALYHCFEFHRDQQFRQTVIACPAIMSFASNFVSGSFQQPGSTQELYKEGVRLATFKDFPVSIPVSALRLAQAGFYYLGEGDQVKCFNCGTTYQGWQLGDRPAAIHARISPSCTLVQGSDRTNLPLPLPVTNLPNFSVTEQSIESGYGSFAGPGSGGSGSASFVDPDSEQSDSHRPMSVTATDSGGPSQLLTSAGFSYEEDGARSGMTLTTDGSALTTPEGRVVAAAASAPIPSSAATSENSMFSGTQPYALATPMDGGAPRSLLPSRRLDLGGAVYPLYSQQDARRRSFSAWTCLPGLPSVDELVHLGFFYAGYADCVRCFFCGIGLKSWEAEDIPAEVHARWRPTCEYLRLVKGDEFVDMVANGGRNVADGTNTSDGVTGQGSGNSQVGGDSSQPPSSNSSQQGSAPSSNSSQQGSAPTIPDIPVVHRARESGYTDAQIAEAIEKLRIIGMEGAIEVMLVEILTNLFSSGASQRNGARNQSTSDAGNSNSRSNAGSRNTTEPPLSSRDRDMQHDGVEADEIPDAAGAADNGAIEERYNALQQENARLREMRTCQQCHVRQVGVIFLPCGHIIACIECAPNIRRCSRCDTVIRATANVFYS